MTADAQALNGIQQSLRDARKRINAVIPDSFGWWLEMDHEIRVSVRWIWLGHPAVTHCGGATDYDLSIVMMFLEAVDWDAEVTAAMEGIENAEALLLRAAQKNRRLRLSNAARVSPEAPAIVLAADATDGTLRAKMSERGPLEIPQKRTSRQEMEKRLQRHGFSLERKGRKSVRPRSV